MNRKSVVTILLLIVLIISSCGNSPKVVETKKIDTNKKSTGVFSDQKTQGNSPFAPINDNIPPVGEDVHTVKALETIKASRYVYIKVQEGEEIFWVATQDQPIEIGKTYHYHGGLLKTNYRSKEHNRVFEKIYLVSNLIGAEHGMEGQTQTAMPAQAQTKQVHAVADVNVAGSTKIKDIVSNPKKYEGKTLQVSGKVVKLNANIMGKNWMHLQDGSNDGFDFVVTSDQMIPEGGVVTLAGVITLKKDFGAGYFYDLIMENATIVKSN